MNWNSRDFETCSVTTSHAEISVMDNRGSGTPVVLLHGNSLGKEVFRSQFGAFEDDRRIVALDLPGHGSSSNAENPRRTYCLEGYADCVVETLDKLNIAQSVVVGWSLGGHIGYELLERQPGLIGLVTVSSPPVELRADGSIAGFQPFPKLLLLSMAELSDAEIDELAALVGDYQNVETMRQDSDWHRLIARTDGRARQYLFEALAGQPPRRQRDLAENSRIPLAIVNGGADRFIDTDYVAALSYRNIWSGKPMIMDGLGHAPHINGADDFNAILRSFVKEVAPR